MPDEPEGEVLDRSHEDTEKARIKRETKIDNEIATRTARMDQSLKERARVAGINPDNFEDEKTLGEAVTKYEEENGVKSEENQ